MKIEEIRKKLALVLEDVERARNSSSEEAFDICQGFLDTECLLSEMIQKLERHETPSIGGFSPDDIRNYLENEEEVSLSEEELESLVEYMIDNFDASVGLSWDLIPLHYENWKERKVK